MFNFPLMAKHHISLISLWLISPSWLPYLREEHMRPLEGIRVLDLTRVLSGPTVLCLYLLTYHAVPSCVCKMELEKVVSLRLFFFVVSLFIQTSR